MSWAFSHIPKRLLLYWGRNQPLSWLRLQTVASFLRHNPEWEVRLYTPEKPEDMQPWQTGEHLNHYFGPDHWEELVELAGGAYRIDWDGGPRSEVHRADLLRYKLLATLGGVWADMDILFIRPMEALQPSVALPADLKAAVCKGGGRIPKRDYHSVGFLMGAEGSEFWASVFEEAKERSKYTRTYQGIGRDLLDEVCPDPKDLAVGNIPSSAVYPVPPTLVDQTLFHPSAKPSSLRLEAQTVGIHWFAGHPMAQDVQMGQMCAINRLAKEGIA